MGGKRTSRLAEYVPVGTARVAVILNERARLFLHEASDNFAVLLIVALVIKSVERRDMDMMVADNG
jgi:hypothetical protein